MWNGLGAFFLRTWHFHSIFIRPMQPVTVLVNHHCFSQFWHFSISNVKRLWRFFKRDTIDPTYRKLSYYERATWSGMCSQLHKEQCGREWLVCQMHTSWLLLFLRKRWHNTLVACAGSTWILVSEVKWHGVLSKVFYCSGVQTFYGQALQ